MTDVDETTITQAVLDRLTACPSPRLRHVSEALVRHLHAFVREVEPTMDEWMAGIEFLTRTGQTCSPTRQEFILLSDTLGVSMLVDAINHRFAEGVTETTVLGPFYVQGPPERPLGADISDGAGGESLLVEGTVRSAAGEPLAGAIVDTWHPVPDDGPVGQLLHAQGRHPYRPAHVHFKIGAPGHQELATHVFVAGDRYLDSDAVFGVKQ